MGLGLGISSAITGGGSSAVVIEDYLWSSTDDGTAITPRFANVTALNVQDHNDAWDIGAVSDWTGGDAGGGTINAASINEMMPATDPNPNYFSDDEGYWVVTEASNAVMTDGEDMTAGQDGDADTELTPIAVGNFPIGDGNYVA